MGDTSIGWTHRPGTRGRTWNPVRGCWPVSPGCANCYAMGIASRFSGPGRPFEGLASREGGRPRWTGEGRFVPGKLAEPLSWREPSTVFVNSMSDLFFEGFSFDEIAAVFGVMAVAQHHTFLVLTKRPGRAADFFGARFGLESVAEEVARAGAHIAGVVWDGRGNDPSFYPANCAEGVANRRPFPGWPLPNVWIGVSAERQREWDERVPVLRELPAAVRFVSQEPALEPIWYGDLSGIDWVIWGGESGPAARASSLDAAVDALGQCEDAGVAFYFKQAGSRPVTGIGPWPLPRADRKGEDLANVPELLRVREWPRTERRAA